MMFLFILQLYSYVSLHQVVCSNEDIWDSKADVIRIQNNGSQLRTIFLPKDMLAVPETTEDPLHGNPSDNFVLISQPKINSNKSANNTQYQEIPLKNELSKTIKSVQKRRKCSQSEGFKLCKIIKKNEEISRNRSLPVEFKINVDKIAKMLNIITIVNFSNEVCHTEDGLVSVCYHPLECKAIGGQPLGPCAQGYGVCCFVERSCGESSAVNNTYITAAGISLDSETGIYICTVHIYKTTPDVQQLRLTFDVFELAGPVNGNCVVDRFVVSGQNDNDIIPPLCGSNTGKHVYVDVDEVDRPIMLTLLSSGAHGVPSNFKVRVTQLRKHDWLRAPNNCLQFYTEPHGTIESFNYISASGYFNNLNYAICFKKEHSYCGIVYTNAAVNGMDNIFEIVNVEIDGTETVPKGQAGAEGFDCPDDYLAFSGIRLCGYKLNDGSVQVDYSINYPVTDSTNGPLVLQFHTNNNGTGRGFHLDYKMIPCSSSGVQTDAPRPPQPQVTSTLSPPAATRANDLSSEESE